MVFRSCVQLIFALAVSGFVVPFVGAQAQDPQQSSSVAETARRARAQKKKSDKAPKVITDENFPANHQPGQDTINVGAPPEAANPDDAAKATADQAAQKETEESAAAREDAEITELKQQLADAEKQLDLQKREFVLDNEVHYSKPDFSSDKAGKAKLDTEQQAIKDQQQQVDGLKARLAPLLERQSRRTPKPTAQPASQNSGKPAAANPQL